MLTAICLVCRSFWSPFSRTAGSSNGGWASTKIGPRRATQTDGVDQCRHRAVLFGHHFSSIAGGRASWVRSHGGRLWLVPLVCVLLGALISGAHDFAAGAVSVRNRAVDRRHRARVHVALAYRLLRFSCGWPGYVLTVFTD